MQRKEGAKRGKSHATGSCFPGKVLQQHRWLCRCQEQDPQCCNSCGKGEFCHGGSGALPAWCGLKGLVVQIADLQGTAQRSPLMSFLTYRPYYWVVEFGAGCGHDAIWPLLTLTARGIK